MGGRGLTRPVDSKRIAVVELGQAFAPLRSPWRCLSLSEGANLAHPTAGKRDKERARAQRNKDKAAERAERSRERANRPPPKPGEDPDIAGIVPGPQPVVEDDYPPR